MPVSIPARNFPKTVEVGAVQYDDANSAQVGDVGGDPGKAHDEKQQQQTDENRHFVTHTLYQSHPSQTVSTSAKQRTLGLQE